MAQIQIVGMMNRDDDDASRCGEIVEYVTATVRKRKIIRPWTVWPRRRDNNNHSYNACCTLKTGTILSITC